MTFTFDEGSRTLQVSGEVDELSGPAFREALVQYSEDYTKDLVVNLDDVDFLPSLGVGVLAVALRSSQEQGTGLELVAKKGSIAQQVLNICGLPHRHA